MFCPKILVSVCLVALLSVSTSASDCQSAADMYVRNRASGDRLLEISFCNVMAGSKAVYMDIIMTSPDGRYVSCLDIEVRDNWIVNYGTCY